VGKATDTRPAVLPDEVELLYLRERKRLTRPVTRPYLLQHAKTIGHTWKAINRDHQMQTWTARRSPLCTFCAFAPGCPAVNPDLPIDAAPPGSGAHDTLLRTPGLSRTIDNAHAPAPAAGEPNGSSPLAADIPPALPDNRT
jgi:hypothetical protein